MDLRKTRNIGICAHIDAGKTTVTERVLYYTGKNYKMGEVHEGTATMDFLQEEQERGITIQSAATTCPWIHKGREYKINLIDTPGHVDFTYEVSRSLAACEGVVLLVDASQGIEAQTLANCYQALEHDLEIIGVLNKIDLPAADPDRVAGLALPHVEAMNALDPAPGWFTRTYCEESRFIHPDNGARIDACRAYLANLDADDEVRAVLAEVREQAGMFAESLRALRAARTLAKGDPIRLADVHLDAARAWLRTGNYGSALGETARAREAWQKAIELDEQNYIAACVLGMVYTYRKLYGTSEHYLRRSLQLNSNDPDTLIQVAVSFLYHGFLEEAWDLYERALSLNPSATDQYCTVGSFILIEKGEFEEALALAARVKEVPFVDAHAYYAAAWMELGNGQKMKENWEIFLQMYTNKINGGKPARSEEAIQWMNQISPYQNKSRVEGLWVKLSHGKLTTRMDSPPSEIPPQSWRNTFSNQDGIWMIEYEGQNCQLPEVKGFFDLTKMLANPRTPFHCAELMGSSIDMEGTPVLDEKSKKAYQDKIVGLQKDIREAESHHDYGRSSQLQEEYQTLLDHLSSALNVKGQSRKKGHTVEKARSAVTWRIRHAIAKIEEAHPQLGKHLSNSIKTGTFCSYEPEKKIEWIV